MIGTERWKSWLSEIRRTRKLYVKEFAPPEVVLREKDSLKGLIVPHDVLESVDEVGNTAQKGQVLFWYGDYASAEVAGREGALNGYDLKHNLYIVDPAKADLIIQAALDSDALGALKMFDDGATL